MFCPNPVAFTVFGHDIYWYGILISLAVVIAVVMVYMQAKKKGIDPDSMLDYALLTIPTAIVFARIYYVIFEWEQYADNPISVLYIWNGGIAIYGSIIGGVIATLIFSKWKKISFWTLADLVAPGLVLGQAAVSANLVSPMLIIVVSVAGLGLFAVPSYPLSLAVRIVRLALSAVSTVAGFAGIALVMFGLICSCAAMDSFGTPYFAPIAPGMRHNADLFVRLSVRRQCKRPGMAHPGEQGVPNPRGWEKGRNRV